MNDLKDFVHVYEQFFKIENSDSWSLNDLLQYTLELSLSGDEDCIPIEVSKDFDLTRKYMLDEINNAISSEQKKRIKIPPMPVVASNISCLGAYLKEDELAKLEKLLNGGYRGKRGEKHNAEKTRHSAIERMLIYRDFRTTMTYENAVYELAEQLGIHERTVQRSIEAGQKYFSEDKSDLFNELDPDMTEFVLRRARLRTIKDEIQTLMSCPDESSKRKCKNDENLMKVLREDFNDQHRDT